MLRSIKQLYGDKLGALDGEIGQVKDFYFDDEKWGVRFVVADTGSWLAGRMVLLSPRSLGRIAPSGKILHVNQTRKQIEDGPSIASHTPVSRQYEEAYHRYFGWPYYWQGTALWGMSSVPVMELRSTPPANASALQLDHPDAHLRSTLAVNGYHLQASDGLLGHVCDFMMDDETWALGQLVIKTGHRLSGKEVRIPTSKVARISYEDSIVFVNLTRDAVEQSPTHYMAAMAEVF
jgi:hypothetical protein